MCSTMTHESLHSVITLRKTLMFHLIFWSGNLVDTHSIYRVSVDLPDTLRNRKIVSKRNSSTMVTDETFQLRPIWFLKNEWVESLTHFSRVSHFCTPWKRQKTLVTELKWVNNDWYKFLTKAKIVFRRFQTQPIFQEQKIQFPSQ